MALGDLGATDLFGIGTGDGWHVQSSTLSGSQDIVDVLNATGDVACQPTFGEENTASAEYELCGDAGAISLTLGDDTTGYIIRSVEFSQEAGQAPRMSIEGVVYDGGEALSDRTYAISETGLTSSALNNLTVAGTGNSIDPTSITRRWEMELVTQLGGDGQIGQVAPRTPMETYEESGSGSLGADPSIANYTLESFENSDSNQELDTYSVSFKKGLVTTVV